MLEKIKKYLNEVVIEWNKVEWPAKNELVNSTIIVFIVIAIFAAYVFLIDIVINTGLNHIMSVLR